MLSESIVIGLILFCSTLSNANAASILFRTYKSPKGKADKALLTGGASGFYRATHSGFKVADTVFAEQRAKNCTRERWEAALRKAKRRAKLGEWPVMISNDF
jgi:hypothetical protein